VCANYWKGTGGETTSPLCTRTEYVARLSGDFCFVRDRDPGGLWISWAKSTAPPSEVFPIWVRQMKVRAQAPLGFLQTGAGTTVLPVAGTVPIGYEMPKPMSTQPIRGRRGPGPPRPDFGAGTDYYNTGKMGDHWEWAFRFRYARLDGARATAFQHHLRDCTASAAGNGITSNTDCGLLYRFRTETNPQMSMARFSIPLRMAKTRCGPTGQHHCSAIAGRSCYLRALQRTQNATWPMFLRTGAAELEKQ